MRGKNIEEIVCNVIDPACPWKLPQMDWSFPSRPFTMSKREWKALLAKAEEGDAESEYEVAWRHEEGCKDRSGRVTVERSARVADYWKRRSAEHGHSVAQCALGTQLSGYVSVEAKWREGIEWLKKAFRGGCDETAANNIAVTYRQQKQFRKAVDWFRKCLAAGDDAAHVQLGVHLYWGIGVRVDQKAAVEHFRLATCGKNLSEAQRDDAHFYLGVAYLEGKGVKASVAKARKLLERANVDDDHLAAQRLLTRL